VDCSDVKPGAVLTISPKYFQNAYAVLFEVGVKLGQVFWRKVRPTELEDADQNLISISYDLLTDGKYDLAKALLDFATDVLKRHSSTEMRMRFVVNRAQAYKWSGNEDRVRAILENEDFSALNDVFKLANSVLRDDFPGSMALIRRIGRSERIRVGDYREWPLFRELRKQPEFEALLVEVFGEGLKVTLQPTGNQVATQSSPVSPEQATTPQEEPLARSR
jgi:hypothetical protein